MITLRTTNTHPIVIDMEMKSPSIYLDHCVISDLARRREVGDTVRDLLFGKNGTLCLSAAHLIETYGLGFGPTFRNIKDYLSTFENRFIILDYDPNSVIKKEREWREGMPFPAYHTDIISEIIDRWDGITIISAGLLLDGLEENRELGDKFKKFHTRQKKELFELFNYTRQAYREDRDVKRNLDRKICPDPYIDGTTAYLECTLRRECVKTNDNFQPQDGLDLFHSIVSVSYCDFVILDKKWTRRLREIDLPDKAAKVFSTIEIQEFCEDLGIFDVD